MIRPIKFRAKTKDGEWATGDLCSDGAMTMTIPQRAVLAIVKEVAQDKQARAVAPADVLRTEINITVSNALDQLVEMGQLSHRLLSVNKINAYAVP